MSLLRKAKNAYLNLRGYHTSRHLLVIESDDWGSIRMPSRETFARLQELGDNPEADAFLSNDSLESAADLNGLFEVLRSVKDSEGHPAVMTANFAMANPDFDRIDFKYNSYSYEPFYNTYARNASSSSNLQMIKDATREGIFLPQLHCREHLNVKRWMRDLGVSKKDTLVAFSNRTMGIGASFSPKNIFGYMDAFNVDTKEDEQNAASVFSEAAGMFENTFGFRSETFVASCFVWNDALERVMLAEGVKGIQCGEWQNIPTYGEGTVGLKRKLHYTGERGGYGQIFSVRNCTYEPAYYQNPKESATSCFADIQSAFSARKPAVINSHRFNYIDSINPGNAERNLDGLSGLLKTVIKHYPDTLFITSCDLIQLMSGEKK